MKKNNKGFTLIELLAVILILGIIALIAIPTVNSILKESRTGAWKSTASQMTKAAENYFQLKQIKNQDYVVDFKTAKSNVTGKYFANETEASASGSSALTGEAAQKVMLAALSLKGDIPKYNEIDLFQIDTNGAVALAFSNTNAYCMTVDGNSDFTDRDYEDVKANATTGSFNASGIFVKDTTTTKLKIGGTAVCVSR